MQACSLTSPLRSSSSSVRGIYRELVDKIKIYNNAVSACSNGAHEKESRKDMRSEVDLRRASLAVKAVAVKLGIHRELELDSVLTVPYTEDEILRIENFAEELATEKITGQLYTMGVPYEDARIKSSVYAMATEPIDTGCLPWTNSANAPTKKTVKHRALLHTALSESCPYFNNPVAG